MWSTREIRGNPALKNLSCQPNICRRINSPCRKDRKQIMTGNQYRLHSSAFQIHGIRVITNGDDIGLSSFLTEIRRRKKILIDISNPLLDRTPQKGKPAKDY